MSFFLIFGECLQNIQPVSAFTKATQVDVGYLQKGFTAKSWKKVQNNVRQ